MIRGAAVVISAVAVHKRGIAMHVKFTPGVQFVIDGQDVLVKSGNEISRLTGEDVHLGLLPVLPLLVSGITVETLPHDLKVSQDRMSHIFSELVKAGFLEEVVEIKDQLIKEESDKLPSRQIYVFGSETISDFMSRSLNCDTAFKWEVSKADEKIIECIEENSTCVVVSNDLTGKYSMRMNQILCKKGLKHIYASVESDNDLRVGPYVFPGSACLACYNARRLSNLTYAYESSLFSDSEKIYSRQSSFSIPQSEAYLLSGVLAQQCKAIEEESGIFQSPLQERVLTANLSSLHIVSEDFFRNPRCKVCGNSRIRKTEIKQWSVLPFNGQRDVRSSDN